MPGVRYIRFHWRAAAGLIGTLVAAGCSPRLRAVPEPSQTVVADNRGLFEYKDGLGLSVVAVGEPPISARREFTAFGVELQNNSMLNATIDPACMRLGLGTGVEWLDRVPVPPDDLVRAYQSADAGNALVPLASCADRRQGNRRYVEITPPELAHVRYYRGPPGCYYNCYRTYVFHDYYYYDGARDAYLWQQERASFLARLLRVQGVLPNQVTSGYVVFPQPVQKRDQFRLLVPITLAQPVATQPVISQPATAPIARAVVFEFHFVAK